MQDELTGEKSALERVRLVRARFEAAFEEKGIEKAGVADYARLLQIERELEGDAPKDITVQWVDTLESDSNDSSSTNL